MSFLLGISALELAAWLALVQLIGEADLRSKISRRRVTDFDSNESALACLVQQFLVTFVSPTLGFVCVSTQCVFSNTY